MSERRSFHFPAESAGALEQILLRSRLKDSSDVIRAALSAYNDLLDVSAGGYDILVRDRSGRDWPYSPHTQFSYPGLAPAASDIATRKAPKSFVFRPDSARVLDLIKSRSYLRSNADVVRAALSAYSELIGVVEAGDQILLRNRQKQEFPYSPFSPLDRRCLELGDAGADAAAVDEPAPSSVLAKGKRMARSALEPA